MNVAKSVGLQPKKLKKGNYISSNKVEDGEEVGNIDSHGKFMIPALRFLLALVISRNVALSMHADHDAFL